MKYLMLIKHAERYRAETIPQGMIDAMSTFVDASFKSGVLKDTAGLKPTNAGHIVRLAKGKLHVIDGPFTEAKEIIGGYALVETDTEAEALQVARTFMELHREHWPAFEGECEVRPLEN